MEDTILIRTLNSKINRLQIAIDSIKQDSFLKQLNFELHEKQDIITQVNDFYDSAWLKLIIVISILGILVPIIAQYFQRRNLKDLAEFIRKQMNDGFELKINELKNFNKTEIEKSLERFKSDIKMVEAKNQTILTELDASTFYLQGRASVLGKEYTLAIPSFLRSAYLYLETDRPERSNVQFVNLKLCLKSINNKKPLEAASKYLKDSSYNWTLDEMIDYFDNHDLFALYEKQIGAVKLELERIKNIS